jgi:hypothetical protein
MPDNQAIAAKAAPGPLISKTGEQPEPLNPIPPVYPGLPPELYEERSLIVLALRLEGYTYEEIEAKTGLSKDQVRYACRKARQAGKLRDVIDLIDNEAVPQAVENLLTLLRDKDKDATFKILDGRGVFRRFNNNKSEGGPGATGIPPLQINIIAPNGRDLPNVIVNSEKGSIVGTAYEEPEAE